MGITNYRPLYDAVARLDDAVKDERTNHLLLGIAVAKGSYERRASEQDSYGRLKNSSTAQYQEMSSIVSAVLELLPLAGDSSALGDAVKQLHNIAGHVDQLRRPYDFIARLAENGVNEDCLVSIGAAVSGRTKRAFREHINVFARWHQMGHLDKIYKTEFETLCKCLDALVHGKE